LALTTLPFSLKRALLAFGLIVLIAPMILGEAYAANRQQAGLMIPLYTYPTDSSWSNLIRGKQTHPNVPVIAIINVYNGPGPAIDSNFVNGIKKLQAAHITVIGYVYTSYASRPISDVEADMMLYEQWYKVNGIFFDNMSSDASTASYDTTLANFAKSQGFAVTVGNRGGTVAQVLVGIFQVTCIYEGAGMPLVSYLTADTGSRGQFAYIAYGVPSLVNNLMTQYVSWLWVTNLSGSITYDGLPSYFTQEMRMLS